MISAALVLAFTSTLALAASPLTGRAGAPSSPQTIAAANVTQCGVANISWSGPGVAPYTLEIGTGGYYVGIEEIVSYANISSNVSSVYWIVNQTAGTDMFFQLTDSSSPYPQVTYIQNIPVLPSLNSTTSTVDSAVNETSTSSSASLSCPLGEGRVYPANGTSWILASAYDNVTVVA